jgi:ATP synthase F1 delta subunit
LNQKVSRQALARVLTAKLLAEPDRHQHWMQAAAAYLVEHHIVEDADLLMNDIAHEIAEQAGNLTVEVSSATALTDDVRAELINYLKRATHAQQVQLHETVNPELIGGLVARTPDAELDVSVKQQLRQLTALAPA